MAVDVKYETKAKATGGRDGAAETLSGSFKVKLATPKELGAQAAKAITRKSCSQPDMQPALLAR